MGFGSFLSGVVRAVVDTALLPVEVAKDVVTIGGALADEREPYTLQRLKKVGRDLDSLPERIDE